MMRDSRQNSRSTGLSNGSWFSKRWITFDERGAPSVHQPAKDAVRLRLFEATVDVGVAVPSGDVAVR